jgi:AcrR family transcriptional regulator
MTARERRVAEGRSARAQATRQGLLDAAMTLFAERGYHATTVPDIVKAAGVGHGTFYQYFKSRREILLALAAEAHAALDHRPELGGHEVTDRIRAEIYWYLFESVKHRDLTKIWNDAARFDDEIAALLRRSRRRRTERVRRGIEALSPRAGIDSAVAAAALTAMLEEFTNRWFLEGEGPGISGADVVAASETLAILHISAITGGAR